VSGPPLKEPGKPGPEPKEHDHDWQVYNTGVDNNVEATMVNVPSELYFVCHCGAYKIVETKEVNKTHYR